jgi:hypothetical protein
MDASRGLNLRPYGQPPKYHVLLRMLKRQMYGRAGYDLLRSRVLRAA